MLIEEGLIYSAKRANRIGMIVVVTKVEKFGEVTRVHWKKLDGGGHISGACFSDTFRWEYSLI